MEAEAWPGPILYVSCQVTWKWGHAFVLDEVRSLSSHCITMGLYVSMLICFSLFQIRPVLQLCMGDKIMLGWIMKLKMTWNNVFGCQVDKGPAWDGLSWLSDWLGKQLDNLVRNFPDQSIWSGEVQLKHRWYLVEVAQMKGGKKQITFFCLIDFTLGSKVIYSLAASAAFLHECSNYLLPASSIDQRPSALETPQACSSRLVLLRHSAFVWRATVYFYIFLHIFYPPISVYMSFQRTLTSTAMWSRKPSP